MNAISINTINDKLKNLSDDFTNEIISYLDSLNHHTDFTNEEIISIKKGKSDYDSGNVYTHEQAREIIQNHIKQKLI